MGLLSHSKCPVERNYMKEYGIPSPTQWKAEDCAECRYQQSGKCEYKKITAGRNEYHKRGAPVLVKRARMNENEAARKKAETDSLKKAGFSAVEIQEYWTVSIEFDKNWETASEEKRRDILDCLDQWKMQLETGLNPAQSYLKVQEWLKQREEFKNRS